MVAHSPLAEDRDHPIPVVDSLDVQVTLKGGGAKLTIVIASPLSNDRRSIDRLMAKFDNYLGFINSGAAKRGQTQKIKKNL